MRKSILVIGIGRFGKGVIESLYEMGHDIFAINKDEGPLDAVRDMVVSGAILDVAENDEELSKIIGEKNFDEAVVAMGEDFEGTLMATQVLKEAGIPVSVKASSVRRGNVLKKMGADRVVFPEREMGQRLAQLISNESIIDILELPQGFVVERIEVGAGFSGQTLEELNVSNRFGAWILLLYREDVPVQPAPDTKMLKGNLIVVFGKKENIHLFEKANRGK